MGVEHAFSPFVPSPPPGGARDLSTGTEMKIQLVFNHRDRLADPSMSIRYERYIEGFRESGTMCP